MRTAIIVAFAFVTRFAFAGCSTPSMTQLPSVNGGSGFGIAVADFNKDGKIDYAVPNGTNVVVYLGNGNGTFATGVPYSNGATSSDDARMIAADLNGDTYPDIALIVRDASFHPFLAEFLNDGDGTFAPVHRETTQASNVTYSIKAFDMNDDGKIDLLLSGESAAIYYGNGDGTFSAPENHTLFTVINATAAGDLNHDGRTDLIVTASQIGSQGFVAAVLAVYLRDANGLPQTPSQLYTVNDPNEGDLLAIELDGDGNLDLVATYPPSKQVFVYKGNGDGSFNPPIPYTVTTGNGNDGMTLITTGDINEDGLTDLVFGSSNAEFATMMTGNGDGTFQPAFSLFLTAANYSLRFHGVAVADFNGDSRPDIMLADTLLSSVFLVQNSCTSRYAAVSLMSSSNPSTYGTPPTLTATVTARNVGHASGTVSFFDGATLLGTATLSGATPSTAAITKKLTLGTHTITAVYSGDGTYGSSSAKLTQVVNRPTYGTPLDLVATGDPNAHTISLQWVGSTNANLYEISRLSGGVWNVIATTSDEFFLDTLVTATQAYFYRVRAFAPDESPTAYSIPDAATTYVYTHTFMTTGTIFAADMNDLRNVVNKLRDAAGLNPLVFTDPTLNGVAIKALHMTQLRSALSTAMTTAGMPAPSFARSIVAGNTVLADDFNETRTMMR